jgi:hypothetical protein
MSHKPDPVEALHAAVLTSSLKMSGAAKAIGRSPGVLYNKFCDSALNELTAREALALSDAIGGTAYVEAVCAYFGGVFIPLPEGAAGQDDVLADYLVIVERMGDLSRELTDARADGVIKPDEFARLTREGHATAASLMTLLADLETMVTAEPAAAPIPLRGVGSR